jgi:hypothetical protein
MLLLEVKYLKPSARSEPEAINLAVRIVCNNLFYLTRIRPYVNSYL